MPKAPSLNSAPWVELAVLAPGHSHYWFFDPAWDAYGWVFQATAYPESPDGSEEIPPAPDRIEVTELFVARPGGRGAERKCVSRVNVTVTNCGDGWASYSLWVASIPRRKAAHRAHSQTRIAELSAIRARR